MCTARNAARRTFATLIWQAASASVVGARTGRGTGRDGAGGAGGWGWVRRVGAQGATAEARSRGGWGGARARERASVGACWMRTMHARAWTFRSSRAPGRPNGLDHEGGVFKSILMRTVSCLAFKIYT